MNTHDIIVCVHNGKEDTLRCLKSIIENKSSNLVGDVIIVDDASDADTLNALKLFAAEHEMVRLYRLDEHSYYTKAANYGLKQSSAKFRTLLNSDTLVTDGWQDRILSVFQSCSAIGIVGPLSNAASTQSVPNYKSAAKQTAVNQLPPRVTPQDFSDFLANSFNKSSPPFVPLVHGFCMTIKSDVIDKIGYLDENLFPNGYGEENDYCFRADDAGFILAIAINTFVYHKKSVSYNNDEQRILYMNNGMAELIKKYGAKRIEYSVCYMESNPVLKKARDLVFEKWNSFYA